VSSTDARHALSNPRGSRCLSDWNFRTSALPPAWRTGPKRKVVAKSFGKISVANLDKNPLWREALRDLRKRYRDICATLGMKIHPATGAATVDHFKRLNSTLERQARRAASTASLVLVSASPSTITTPRHNFWTTPAIISGLHRPHNRPSASAPRGPNNPQPQVEPGATRDCTRLADGLRGAPAIRSCVPGGPPALPLLLSASVALGGHSASVQGHTQPPRIDTGNQRPHHRPSASAPRGPNNPQPQVEPGAPSAPRWAAGG